MQTIVFYISGHGFGHASREIEVINALLARSPDLRIMIRTAAARRLFDRTVRMPAGLKATPARVPRRGPRQPGPASIASGLRPAVTRGEVEEGPGFSPGVYYHHLETDTGIVQIDSLHLDIDASIRRARDFMRGFAARAAEEAAFLRQAAAALVVADIPPLGIAAGVAAEVPTVALSNFTWDWVYSAYAGTEDIVAATRGAYAGADLALRLPMHGGFEAFSKVVDVPFIARRSRREPADTRRTLGLPLNERLVLVSFGGYGLGGLDIDALSRLDGYVVLLSGRVPPTDLPHDLGGGRRGSLQPFDESTMYAAGLRYEDLVRAVDVVLTKPGYGIIAECLANQTALLYTSRGPFIEYDVLAAAMPRFLRTRFIDHRDLFAGRWVPHLDALLAQPPPPEHPAVNGADVAASLLLDMIGGNVP